MPRPDDEPPSSGASETDDLLEALYTELRNVARRRVANGPPGATLTATALVHEVWLRLKASGSEQWRDRSSFFAAAGTLMRNIMVDRAREKASLKRGGDRRREELSTRQLGADDSLDDLRDVHEALEALEREDPRCAQLVVLRFFAGMTIDEAAQALEIAPRTARKDWTFARTWLYDVLTRDEKESDS